MNTEQKGKIENLLKKSKYGVIATAGATVPESALITIVEITEEGEIIFGSFKTARKNRNIQQNPKVSFVVWDLETRKTMQMEGEAMHIPHNEQRNNLEHEYFKISPSWVRYSDFGAAPKEVWEIEL